MAKPKGNITQLQSWVKSPGKISDNSFELLKAISGLLSDVNTANYARELLIWLLVHKNHIDTNLLGLFDELVYEAGLMPYVSQPDNLQTASQIIYEFQRPIGMKDRVLHTGQMVAYLKLIAGRKIILSAPTSFGKSLLIDTIIEMGKFNNIVIIVPTIALIDETRKRLLKYLDRYEIISQNDELPGQHNIFIWTQERCLSYPHPYDVDFFVVDEFYKLNPSSENDERAYLLNLAFYRLFQSGAQFYLLGPNIKKLAPNLQEKLACQFIKSDFSTVVSEIHHIERKNQKNKALINLAKELEGPTLIYCATPKSARDVAALLIEAGVNEANDSLKDAVDWLGNEYHTNWIVAKALAKGIGIHHGKLPRPIAQFIVRAFNDKLLKFLVCTSTLIEGVNTVTKNVIIYQNKIGGVKRDIDYFTYSNIKGRAGRMFSHFDGHVFVFDDPPQDELPEIDFPAINPTNVTPLWLLLHLEHETLPQQLKDKLAPVLSQKFLSLDVLKINIGIDVENQIQYAQELTVSPDRDLELLAWNSQGSSRSPSYTQLAETCRVVWEKLLVRGENRNYDVRWLSSYRMLAFLIDLLRKTNGPAAKFQAIVKNRKDWLQQTRGREDVSDEAVEQALEFTRTWIQFRFPKYLRALDLIIKDVKPEWGSDYSRFADEVENMFLSPAYASLEEYGIPISTTTKLEKDVSLKQPANKVLRDILALDLEGTLLSNFEKRLVKEAKNSIS
jgi:hypothetical protein